MKLAVKFYQQQFSGEVSKQAYLDACKWLATYIIGKDEMGGTLYEINKVEADLPTFLLELYSLVDSEDSTKNFCSRCKEFHSLFYMNQQYNCDACNYTAFKDQMKSKLKAKKDWKKQRLLSYIPDDEV